MARGMRDLFDDLAGVWEDERGSYRSAPLGDALTRGGPFPAGACLEVGSGTGLLSSLLAPRWTPVMGLDLSWKMLRQARSGPVVQGDAACIPSPAGVFAAVVVADAPLFAPEVVRVLRGDGTIIWSNALGDGAPFHVPTAELLDAVSRATGTAHRGRRWRARPVGEVGWSCVVGARRGTDHGGEGSSSDVGAVGCPARRVGEVRKRSAGSLSGTGVDRHDAFGTAMVEHGPRLARLAFYLCGDRTRAEDLVAAAFAATWPRWSAGRVDSLLPYLRRVMVNLAAKERRHWLVVVRHDERADPPPVGAAADEGLPARLDLTRALQLPAPRAAGGGGAALSRGHARGGDRRPPPGGAGNGQVPVGPGPRHPPDASAGESRCLSATTPATSSGGSSSGRPLSSTCRRRCRERSRPWSGAAGSGGGW